MQKNRSFLKEAEPTCVFGSRGNNSCPMAQVLNIEEVLEALNVAGPADPANAGDGHADHVAQPGGRGRRRGGNRGRGRGRRGRGLGPGFGDPRGCGRGRRVAKKMANKRTEQQAAAYNRSGRARTSDRRFLESGSLDGRRPTGRGAWKCWTPEAVLRYALSDEKGAYRQTASQVDGAGHMHAGGSRFVIAGATVFWARERVPGMERYISKRWLPLFRS